MLSGLKPFEMIYFPDVYLNVDIQDVARGKYRNARIVQHHGHCEWTRQGEGLHPWNLAMKHIYVVGSRMRTE